MVGINGPRWWKFRYDTGAIPQGRYVDFGYKDGIRILISAAG